MQIAIASGKGGTGKTTVSVGLAEAYAKPVVYLDCDVEEPNGAIFLKPVNTLEEPVTVLVPEVDAEKCTACGKCSQICQFNAIITLGSKAMVFPEMCHSCGGCATICPTGAIREVDSEIGTVKRGISGEITVFEGVLDIGHAMAPPIIRAVKKNISDDLLNIIDCPPGTSCPLLTAVKGVDFVILVTEPTPFGLHDLKLSVDTMRELKLPFGIIINRSDSGDSRVVDYCNEENIELLLEIPESRTIAEAYSRGESIVSSCPELKDKLNKVLTDLMDEYGGDK